MQKESIEYLEKAESKFPIKIGDMVVNIEYSDNNKSFNECMLNIFRRKTGK